MRAILLLLVVLLITAVQVAYAGTSNIETTLDNTTTDGSCTLREAIIASNSGVAGDCVGVSGTTNTFLITNGNYTLGSALPAITSNITISRVGGGSVVIQANASPNTATYRVFNVSSTGSLTLNFLIVENGVSSSSSGGCIAVSGSLTVTGTTIRNCSAVDATGGAVQGEVGSSITVQSNSGIQSSFQNNSSTHSSSRARGGAILAAGAISISGASFTGNSATSSGAEGGALWLQLSADTTITNTTFTSNRAESTGALPATGGAIQKRGASLLTITTSRFITNQAIGTSSSGGAVYVIDGPTSITASRLEGNTADSVGDALFNQTSSTVSISGSCITGNGDTAVFDYFSTGSIDATGGGSPNWWGTSWGPRIPARPSTTGSYVSNGDSINGDGNTVSTTLVDVNLSTPGDYNTAPTGDWLTSAPSVAGATCQTCTSISSTGHGRTCS